MAHVRRDFLGRRNVETFARACVQPIGDGVRLPLGVARQIGALRQVLTEQAIRVFIGAALPGTMRISKEDADREALGQPFVFGPSLFLDHASGFSAASRAHVGVSS